MTGTLTGRIGRWCILAGLVTCMCMLGMLGYHGLRPSGHGPLVSSTSGTIVGSQVFHFMNFTSVEVEGDGVRWGRQEFGGRSSLGPCMILEICFQDARSLTVSDEHVGNGELEIGEKVYRCKALLEHFHIGPDGSVSVLQGNAHPAVPLQILPAESGQ